MNFVDVILPVSIEGTFTYTIPTELHDAVKVGQRVEVSFGKKRNYAAIVLRMHDTKPMYKNIKPILRIIDEQPVIDQRSLALWQWMADYYMCALGEVMQAAMPAYLKMSSETCFYPNTLEDVDREGLSDSATLLLHTLEKAGQLSQSELEKLLPQKRIYPSLQELIDQRAIIIAEELKDKVKPKTVKYLRLGAKNQSEEALQELFAQLAKSPRQEEALLQILQSLGNDRSPWIDKSELKKSKKIQDAAYRALLKKGIIEEKQVRIDRVRFPAVTSPEIVLSSEQEEVYKKILRSTQKSHLIHGITGSGKTYIYMQLIKYCIAQGKQALITVPEIALSAQLIGTLSAYFGDQMTVYHSKYNSQERAEVYQKVKNKQISLVLGVRSAILLPFADLGLVVVDEEQDNSYKQRNPAPRYHTPEVAQQLVRQHDALLVLGSATPSMEAVQACSSQQMEYHKLIHRYAEAQLPTIEIVDVRREQRAHRHKSIISPRLEEAIKTTLLQSQQVLLFQNRRGYDPFLYCDFCGQVPSCTQCDVSLTYHKHQNALLCHYCGLHYPVYSTCPSCRVGHLSSHSFGTEKVAEEVAQLFPHARIQRMDQDTTRGKKNHEKIIQDFASRKLDILVGTQMITKGLHFENVALVGILSAEASLFFPDFRAHENSLQTWIQVAGRAGRAKQPGLVLIQTTHPELQLLQDFQNNNYEGFVKRELRERREFIFPPYCHLSKVIFRHKNKQILERGARYFYEHLDTADSFKISQAQEPAVSMIKNTHILESNIKVPLNPKNQAIAREKLRAAKTKTLEHKDLRYIYIYFDVDTY